MKTQIRTFGELRSYIAGQFVSGKEVRIRLDDLIEILIVARRIGHMEAGVDEATSNRIVQERP